MPKVAFKSSDEISSPASRLSISSQVPGPNHRGEPSMSFLSRVARRTEGQRFAASPAIYLIKNKQVQISLIKLRLARQQAPQNTYSNPRS
jgi:hypothetical protein